jgi:protein-S-isoprenylcysteine O-methyltransferase Ste14
MHISIGWGFAIAWGTMGAVWLAGAPFNKRKARDSSTALRMVQGVMMFLGYFLISDWGYLGWLNRTLWTRTWTVAWTGLALTCVGILYAIWARVTLGSNWSMKPMVKHGHELVIRGPYALTRHPIYTGLLLAGVGTAMAVDEFRGPVGIALLLVAMTIKIRQEERLMTETFPEAYPAYRRRVRALVPWVV